MGAFESKILDLLKEATAAGNYPADFSADVKQATVPQADAIDKKWPMEAEEEDEDKMVVEDDDDFEDDDSDDDMDDMDDMDADDMDDSDDEDDEMMTEGDDTDEDDLDKTFSEMISRLKEDESDKSDDEDDEMMTEDDDKDEDDEEPVVEMKKKKGVKESKKKVSEDSDDMPEFLKKKLDKDGDGEPDIKESTEVDDEDPKLQVTESDDEDEIKDDEKAIFGDASLPEDFRKKASMVFEAAIKSRAAESRRRVSEEATKNLKEAYAVLKKKTEAKQVAHEAKLAEQVDRYLTYVSSQWLKENRLAIEAGIRAELAEDFIGGLKKLFVEHYIEIPQTKVDVVKMMGKKLSKMEGRLNEQAKENVKLRESLTRYRRDDMVRSASNGLTVTQSDKLKKLAEGITFQNREQFSTALNTLKESYFPKEKAKGTLTEQDVKKTATKTEAVPLEEDIAVYVKTLNKNVQS